jgi:hypothetical protein
MSFACKYCKREFTKESTLAVHMCSQKRRYVDKELSHIQLAFRTYQLFYEINMQNAKTKTYEEFAESNYYNGFVKFGRKMVSEELLEPKQYAEWLIRNSVKLADWTKDSVYDSYLKELIKKEPAQRAIERSIKCMESWGKEKNMPWSDYFRKVSPQLAIHHIRGGKISPWFLFLSESGQDLWGNFNSEQLTMIKDIAEPNFWKRIFLKNTEEVELVQEIVEVSQL